MPTTKIKLKIAGILISLQSDFPLQKLNREEKEPLAPERFENFFCKSNKKADIVIDIRIVNKLPRIQKSARLFVMYRPGDKKNNWQFLKRNNGYIYKCDIFNIKQVMFINNSLDRVNACLLHKKEKGYVWYPTEIIYDFLQILLIHYFARRNLGIFVHSMGIRDASGRGFIFAGKSGAGKSTLARIWHDNSAAKVLNDDRIVIRKIKGEFFIYGVPWHGDFADYLVSRMERAPLSKLFFIRHFSRNSVRPLSESEIFDFLYPVIFPTFWDKKGLENITSFCRDMIRDIPCFSLGFAKNKKIVDFVTQLIQTS